ncbi:protein MOS2-like [Quercus lobata]|uniref:G-patch domain-containing protein n=1 Tax=Quercus lobata TaxID=97700 RepID=A0A7N2N1K1_QUELO|nr:protein MOS2-like [Quercus lobata]XP_030947076.1 protein MOS2-like [Quercus lobata]XP_030947077.1 protein MOS2-like [Quercus lobata]XP_030947079.1 protein MOS2-like [Quercus lobata]
MMKFSLQSKKPSSSSSKPKPIINPSEDEDEDEQEEHSKHHQVQFITEFDASSKTTQPKRSIPVIAPIENEWRPHKRMKNLELPISSSSAAPAPLSFEAAAPDSLDDKTTISYGLTIRNNNKAPNSESNSGGGGENVDEQELPPPPPRSDNNNKGVENMLLQKLKDDLKRLPEDKGFQEFDDTPVEGFGKALIAGYGWKEGRGIGKNAKEDVEIVVQKRHTGKHGLGFVEKVDEPFRFSVGKNVRVIAGRDVGLKGRIVKVLESKSEVVLELSKSEEKVQVRVEHLAELGSKEEEICLNKLREAASESKKRKMETMTMTTTTTKSTSIKASWLKSHIRVRIISKDLKGGRLYLKKGEVVDVVGPRTCDVSMDESRELIQGVSQDFLETALPRCGGPVLVLCGKHDGVLGNLVSKDLEQETAVVQDGNNHEYVNVWLDQIVEYIGDPTYLGY